MISLSMSHFFIMITFLAKLNTNCYNQNVLILLLLLGSKECHYNSDLGHCKRFSVDPGK